jgi:hypothetical protein
MVAILLLLPAGVLGQIDSAGRWSRTVEHLAIRRADTTMNMPWRKDLARDSTILGKRDRNLRSLVIVGADGKQVARQQGEAGDPVLVHIRALFDPDDSTAEIQLNRQPGAAMHRTVPSKGKLDNIEILDSGVRALKYNSDTQKLTVKSRYTPVAGDSVTFAMMIR